MHFPSRSSTFVKYAQAAAEVLDGGAPASVHAVSKTHHSVEISSRERARALEDFLLISKNVSGGCRITGSRASLALKTEKKML